MIRILQNKWATVRKYTRLWESEIGEHGFTHSQDRNDCQEKNVARTGATAREKQISTIRNWWTGYTQWSSSVIRLNEYHASRQHGKQISGLCLQSNLGGTNICFARFKAKNLRSRLNENQTASISLKHCCPSQGSVYIRRESRGRSSSPKD